MRNKLKHHKLDSRFRRMIILSIFAVVLKIKMFYIILRFPLLGLKGETEAKVAPKHWALLVAGSDEYINYRHQVRKRHRFECYCNLCNLSLVMFTILASRNMLLHSMSSKY